MTEINVETRSLPDGRTLVIVEFRLPGPVTPGEAPGIAEKIRETVLRHNGDVVAVSGRGPIWLYGMIIHELVHVVPVLAVYDPKTRGYVVVASHVPGCREGEVIPQ